MNKTDKHFLLSCAAVKKLSEDAKKAGLKENIYLEKIISENRICEKPDNDFWDLLHDLYDALNNSPDSPAKTEIETILFKIKKKYVYGNNKTLGSK